MTKRNAKTREGYEYWDRMCSIQRYGFIHLSDNTRIIKAEGIGPWIDGDEALKVVDEAQIEINILKAEVKDLKLQVQAAIDTSLSSVQVADRLIYERDVLVAARDILQSENKQLKTLLNQKELPCT